MNPGEGGSPSPGGGGPALPLAFDDEAGWGRCRAAQVVSTRLNLNPGTLGTPVRAVALAMEAFRTAREGWPLGQYIGGREAIAGCRARVARLWPHPTPAMGHGTTAQMAVVLAALAQVRPVARVLTTTDEHEGAVAGFLAHPGFSVEEVPPESLAGEVRKRRPDIVLVSQVNWTDGRAMPVAEVVAAAGEAWVVTDVAQALGVCRPDLLGDIVVGSLHKWVAGPPGTGVTWLSERARARLGPLVGSGHPLDPEAPAPSFEPAGAQDFARWAGLDAALAHYQAVTPVIAHARSAQLARGFASALVRALPGRHACFDGARWVEGPAVTAGNTVVLRFPEAVDPYPLYRAMDEAGIHCKCIKGPVAGGAPRNQLRFGIPWLETADRLDAGAARIGELARAHLRASS